MSSTGFQRRPLDWLYSSRITGFSGAKDSGNRRSTKRFSCAWYARSSSAWISVMASGETRGRSTPRCSRMEDDLDRVAGASFQRVEAIVNAGEREGVGDELF